MNGDDTDDDGGQYQAFLAGREIDAWQEFSMTGAPSALANYLECGGDVDDNTRIALIDLLRNGPKLINKGGRNLWRDYTTYVEVKCIAVIGISKTEACRIYAERTNQELRTVEKQYDRGSKIYGPESDLFVRVHRDHEK